MRIVDAHCHFWRMGGGRYPWLETRPANLLGDYTALARDFTLGHLQALARQAGIELAGVVHVEANAADPLAETRWLEQELKAQTVAVPVVLMPALDLAADDVADMLAQQLASSPRVRGVRQILNVHADPRLDYVGRHYLREPGWQRGLALLEQHGLIFELQLYPAQMPEAAALVARYPGVRFVLNHAGMYVDRQAVQGWREWRDGLRALAACRNVQIKLSGFGMLDHHWTTDSLAPLVFEAIDAFGSVRCMFASNFPVCSLFSSYQRLWQTYDSLLAQASSSERAALFADNAQRFYQLQG